MKRQWAIVWGQAHAIVKRPVNLIFVVAIPLTMAVTFGNVYEGLQGGAGTVGIVTEGDGPITRRLVTELEAAPLTTTMFEQRTEAERSVRRRTIDAIVVIPASVDQPDGGATEIELVGAPGVAAPGGVRTAVQLATARVAATVVVAGEAEPDDLLGAGLDVADREAAAAGIEPVELDTTNRERNAKARALFGMLVLFTFLNVMAGGGDLASMRQQGVLTRLRATSLSDRRIVTGFVGWLGLYGLVQAGILAIAGTLLLGIRWDRPFVLAATVVLVALAAASLSALMSTVLPPYPIGTSVAGVLGFALGLLGGCMWSLDAVSPTMRAVGYLTPQAWAMDALMSTVEGTGVTGTARSLAVLAAFTVTCATLATALVRRRVGSAG